jgi:hypothetical protein
MKTILVLSIYLIFTGCKHRVSNESETLDVLRQGEYGPSEIIYVVRNDSGVYFHYRQCTAGTVPTRDCADGSESTPIQGEEYVAAVPEDVFDRFDPNFRRGGADVTLKRYRGQDVSDWATLTAPFDGGRGGRCRWSAVDRPSNTQREIVNLICNSIYNYGVGDKKCRPAKTLNRECRSRFPVYDCDDVLLLINLKAQSIRNSDRSSTFHWCLP